ncbi:MAG: hypothetical protein K9L23_20605 [Desulfotignum sp.]|nr:hypothetical protein [Desulfotignum sp.]
MKKMILTASVLSMLVMSTPLLAVEAHHPESQNTPIEARIDADKMDASVQQMQEMRKKIETEKNPAARKELMHQHMQMMKDGMNMMTMMGGQGGMMTEQKDTASMPMADRMAMMEKMMSQGGGMMGGGAFCSSLNDRLNMMKKEMMMIQEMMNGMMMIQETMMK